MARAKRWTVPFVSLNGTSCRVDIYEEGWSGGVTELSTDDPNAPGCAAADPFFYEEDNSEDLLSVIRVKTGYLNMVELTYGGLADLYPDTDDEHYIEFYYGNTLDFTGFIQAQAFENQWTAPPRQVSFAIQSPLGLLGQKKFSPRYPFAELSTRDILLEIINGLNAAYTSFYLPDSSSNALNSYLLAPFNDSPVESDGSDMYDPMLYEDALVGICNLHGLIVHDTPYALVFSRFDYSGGYHEYNGGTSFDANEVEAVSDYLSVSSDQGKDSLVKPLGKITVKYDGNNNFTRQMNFDHMPFVGMSIVNWSSSPMFIGSAIAWLKMQSPEFYSRDMLSSQDLDSARNPTQKGVIGAASGDNKFVLVYCNNLMDTNSRAILEWRIPQYPGFAGTGQMDIRLNVTKHNDIGDAGVTDNPFYISVEVDGEYYNNTDYDFDSTVHKYFPDANGRLHVWANIPSNGLQMKITLWGSAACTDGALFKIHNLSAELQPEKLYQYKDMYKTERVIEGEPTSYEEGSVDMVFSRDKYNSHSLIYAGMGGYTPPAYPYLFKSQNRLQADFKGTIPDVLPLYLYKWTYWVSGWHWRIIALAFHPWTDEYTLTMHRSSTI